MDDGTLARMDAGNEVGDLAMGLFGDFVEVTAYTDGKLDLKKMMDEIEFIAEKSIIDQIFEWFGKDVKVFKSDDENKVRVHVKASPNAMLHWAMQYIDNLEVTAPERLRSRIKEALK